MTRELVMTARPFGAAEAKDLGFLNRVGHRPAPRSTAAAYAGPIFRASAQGHSDRVEVER
jgi:enoyl-CoA hydratase/carnithine racemase